METVVLNHPLISHKLAILRNKETGTKEFREIVSEIAMFLCYEAMKNVELEEIEIETPLKNIKVNNMKIGKFNEDKLAFVPILRAGTGMLDGVISVVPNAKIGHIGIYRDENVFVQKVCEMIYRKEDMSKLLTFLQKTFQN